MRTEIRFILNGQQRRVAGIAPHTMLLDWLRSQGLTAVKEGCAKAIAAPAPSWSAGRQKTAGP